MRIAVDAVGGDFVPKNPVEGALEALAAAQIYQLF
jgi:fatty acid/phospholipid biosynthesis enzyme